MHLVDASRMRDIDRTTIEGGHVSGSTLMDRAGRGVFEIIRRHFGGDPANRRVVIVCGKGNNGGDGFVIARCLIESGADVHVFVLGGDLGLSPAAKSALRQLVPLQPALVKFSAPGADTDFAHRLREADLVVDALFGTGINSPLRDDALEVVRAINQLSRCILSVDVPSGFSGDMETVLPETVRADMTATIGLPKHGLYYYPGTLVAGDVSVVDIGFPDEIIDELGGDRRLVDMAVTRSLLPHYDPAGHKYNRGAVLIVAGSRRYAGAALLSIGAALRGGVGMVYAAVPESLREMVQSKWPSAVTIGLPENEDGFLSCEALATLRIEASRVQAVALGPGLGREETTQELIRQWLGLLDVPTVIDADALLAWGEAWDVMATHPAERVLTPHSGELGAMLGLPGREVDRAREKVLRKSRRDGIVLLHKGAPTEVIGENGVIHTIAGGHPAMARGGTGDVLTGLIGSLLAQAPERPLDAALAAAWLHAEAGRLAAVAHGRALCSADILTYLPVVWRELETKELWREDWSKRHGAS
ncbi:MAG: NAD(P)H-hydrate dehydratase [bacterium]|nr:NAD(P)H-hydrate dehydratase [bacterium]